MSLLSSPLKLLLNPLLLLLFSGAIVVAGRAEETGAAQ